MMAQLRCPDCGESNAVVDPGPGSSVACRCGRLLTGGPGSSDAPGGSALASLGAGPVRGGRLGKYRIERELGAGSFGKVYLAYHDDLEERPVALKVPTADVLRSATLRERFRKEARAIARVSHRCIVRIYEVGPEGGDCYIATEYLAGRTLREVLEAGPIEVGRAAWIAAELAEALAHAHAAGVLHRDVKPSNVMLTEAGEVKLIDFGLARLDTSTMTGDQAMLGTLVYMSPEQTDGDTSKVREPSDQYNLGAVLFEMLCGVPPHGSDGRFVLHRIRSQVPPRLRSLNPAVTPELEEACLKALAIAPKDRHPTCRSFAEALRRRPEARSPDWGPVAIPSPAPPSPPPGPGRPSALVLPSRAETADTPTEVTCLRSAFRDLVRLIGDRAEAEESVARKARDDLAALGRDVEMRRATATNRAESARSKIFSEQGREVAEARTRLESGLAEADGRLRTGREGAEARAAAAIVQAQEGFDWVSVEANAVFEVRQGEMDRRWKSWDERVQEARVSAGECREDLDDLARRFPEIVPHAVAAVDPGGRASFGRLRDRLEAIQSRIDGLSALPARRRSGGRRLWHAAVAAGAIVIALGWLVAPRLTWALVAVAATAGLVLLLRRPPWARAKWVAAAYAPLCVDLSETLGLIESVAARADRAYRGRSAQLEHTLNRTVRSARRTQGQAVTAAEKSRSEGLIAVVAEHEATTARVRREAAARHDHADRLARLDRELREILAAVDQDEATGDEAIHNRKEAAVADFGRLWRRGLKGVRDSLAGVAVAVDAMNPPWDAPDWDAWSSPVESAPLIRLGEARVGLDMIPRGRPEDDRLIRGLPDELAWPLLLHGPDRLNLLIEAPETGLDASTRVLQAALVRLVTGLPAGGARLTIVDPVGLGSDFGAFFELADVDEALCTVKTEPGQIEQALADLGGHIKKMIGYLRGDLRTIEDFNREAGEAAEPTRVLAIVGFPTGFSQVACEWLTRIVELGARCGVRTLIVADPTRPIPGALSLAAMASGAVHLTYRGGRLVWEDADFSPFPLFLDPPPPPGQAARALRAVGLAAADARRVQIPFELVVPPRDRWWTADGSIGIDVPIGKAGPSKLQSLALGRGTSQHVLVAGRTGSGKSTLLHALITSLALHYSPEDLELYLIDFKKGVEFNVYARRELPHARVIAVESEREFGLSVLQRLDRELKERGERFRQAGVQDLRSYRGIKGLPPLPRTLLIVDEFQEYFVEDDSLAAEAGLLLDRLVRQGRAFGVHILLGSQSLGGAYTLARSTLGQMSVRIALQCSEADSRLILSDENGAARLLSRSGEAIYNDANGVAEGNHFFQVVWQPEDVREGYLRQIRELAIDRRWTPPTPTVVFEGNAPALLDRNADLSERLAADGPPTSAPRCALAYLGDSVAIKGPTAARFRRQPGDNLLIVGQDANAARGMLASALIGLAAQYPASGPEAARFWVLDGTPEEAEGAGTWARVAAVPPQAVRLGGRRDVPGIVGELARIVAERIGAESGVETSPGANPLETGDHYLFLHNLGWFRDLRKSEDDYFSATKGVASPADDLALILREGAAVGVHVLAWSDSMGNLNRTLDRASRREFTARVATQMSAADSSQYLDAPTASRLGHHRALLLDEDQGSLEKFRPYGPPATDWLESARVRLRRAGPA